MSARTRWGLIGICLVAFGLRLGPLWANRFHPDEALYAYWGLLIRTGRDAWLGSQAVDKPPLQFYLMAVSFYYAWRCEAAARLPGLLAGTLSVPLLFQIARGQPRPGTPVSRGGGLAALLMALSPYGIAFSGTAFLDPLMVALALAACAAAVRKRAGLAGGLLGLSIATKLTGALFLPWVIGSLGWRSTPRCRCPTWQARFWAGLLGIAALVIAWDRLKGGPPFWVLQAIHYGGVRLVPLAEWLPRLRAWASFLPYFFGWGVLVVLVACYLLLVACYSFALRAVARLLMTQREEGHASLAACHLPHATCHIIPSLPWGSPLVFGMFYFAVHWLLSFQAWDRYLLGLVPVAALWADALASSLHLQERILARANAQVVFYVVLVALLLPPAVMAASSRYPIGGDHGLHDGIEQVADYLRGRPVGTVVYDRWLGWEFEYYLWDAQVYRAHFPTLDVLYDDLRAFGSSAPRYVALPAYAPAQPVLDTIRQAGLEARAVLSTTNRYGQSSFSVYQIAPGQAP